MAHSAQSLAPERTLWTHNPQLFKHVEVPAGFLKPLAARGGCRRLYPARAKTEVDSEAALEIENVDRNYCDDFVCTSSPSVEQTVKAFAFDLEKATKWTLSRFAQDVEYKDAYRAFTGRSKYSRPTWIDENVQDAKVVVKRMRMEDQDTAVIDWDLTGSINMVPLDVSCKSSIQLNLLTGQVEKHTDEWDLSKCSLPASGTFFFSRITWAMQEGSKDAQEQIDQLSQSLTSVDGEEEKFYGDPTDPTKFFQQNDTTMQDALTLAAFLAFVYAMYQSWSYLFTLQG